MNRAITFAAPVARAVAVPTRLARLDPVDTLRSLIVLGCAAALILASNPLPF
ncbi:MAG: hypothetical protein V2I74_05640 [Erythrobacter sp.]|nr:hypothetical protein [Erythrobacter sp.]